jgi:DNA-binding helix-hairpin-helix protein with protein kinase domain
VGRNLSYERTAPVLKAVLLALSQPPRKETMLFVENQKVKLVNGRTATVVPFKRDQFEIGRGGQGVVYKVNIDGTNEEKALKWYFNGKPQGPLYKSLEANISSGSPSDKFVWPEVLTEDINGTFGYVMRIYPPEYKEFGRFLLAREKFHSVKATVDAAINTAAALVTLHDKGYSYQDLNDDNLAINPANGDVLFCDNDNVVGQGMTSGIKGKQRYMAPEVVRGDKMPDKRTDRFSLAVVLHLILLRNHPLEGAKTNVPVLTASVDRIIFGTEPLYMFDEQDDRNRPVPGLHNNAIRLCPYYPAYIPGVFKRTFSQDNMLRDGRYVSARDWLHSLMRLKSSIAACPYCKDEIFLADTQPIVCPSCRKDVQSAGHIKFARRANIEVTVPIFDGICLYGYHLSGGLAGFNTTTGCIITKDERFGLENQSTQNWTITAAGGANAVKNPGEVVPLNPGMKIDFGNDNIAEIISN